MNGNEGVPKSPIQRIRERISPATKEHVRSVFEKTEALYTKMREKNMTELHVAYALLSAGLTHESIQHFLDLGVQSLFEPNTAIDPAVVEQLVDRFDPEKDADKRLILKEE